MSDWTTLRALEWTTSRFARANFDSPRLEAQVLLAHVLRCDRVRLYMDFDKPLGADELAGFRALIQRRLAGEPVAYLVGTQEFWSLSLQVDERVLIPRRDTETIVSVALEQLGDRARAWRIADVATGSGAIALALASELRAAVVVATDVSAGALAVARANAEALGLADRVELRAGDLLEPLAVDPPVDALVSNPPYVPTATLPGLQLEVRREPVVALDGGSDGLAVVRRLVAGAAPRIAPDGLLAIEHGADQGEAVRACIDATGAFAPAATQADLAGRPRVSFARRR